MKQEIFNTYTNRVCDIFSVDEKILFEKVKRQDVVDARHLLYYLCSQRFMKVVYIMEYMAEKGYVIGNSSVQYGINAVKKRAKKDKDYKTFIKEINNEV